MWGNATLGYVPSKKVSPLVIKCIVHFFEKIAYFHITAKGDPLKKGRKNIILSWTSSLYHWFMSVWWWQWQLESYCTINWTSASVTNCDITRLLWLGFVGCGGECVTGENAIVSIPPADQAVKRNWSKTLSFILKKYWWLWSCKKCGWWYNHHQHHNNFLHKKISFFVLHCNFFPLSIVRFLALSQGKISIRKWKVTWLFHHNRQEIYKRKIKILPYHKKYWKFSFLGTDAKNCSVTSKAKKSILF